MHIQVPTYIHTFDYRYEYNRLIDVVAKNSLFIFFFVGNYGKSSNVCSPRSIAQTLYICTYIESLL